MTTAAVLAEFEPLRIGLTQTFAAAGIEVISQAGSLEQLISCGTEELVDVQVMELRSLGPELEALRGRDAWLRRQRAVFLGSAPGVARLSIDALQLLTQAQSAALLRSDGDVSRLVDIVQLVAAGMFVCDMDAMKPVFSRLSLFTNNEGAADMAPAEQLSPRELEVLRLVAFGMDNRRIAEEMVVSEGTVKAHVSHILAKVSVRTRPELVRYALTREVFPAEEVSNDSDPSATVSHIHRHITVRVTAHTNELQSPPDESTSGGH
jgi:DNA-binding NarL/FixJ family response regulator